MGVSPSAPPARHSSLHDDAAALRAAVSDLILIRAFQFRDRDRICCHNMSVTQCHALEALVEHGPLRLGELTERLWLDKSTTSRVVRTLVKKGYVRQQPDAVDARATTLSATPAGRRLCGRITADPTAQQKEVARAAAVTTRRKPAADFWVHLVVTDNNCDRIMSRYRELQREATHA